MMGAWIRYCLLLGAKIVRYKYFDIELILFWGMWCSKPAPDRQKAFAKLALLVTHGNILVGLLSV